MIVPRGDIKSPIWIVLRTPSDADNGAGTPISGTEGFHFDKLFDELGLPSPYITTIEQNSLIPYDTTRDPLYSFLHWTTTLDVRPVLIGLYDKPACELLTPETRNYKKPYDTKLDKWAGSLLVSPLLNWTHYCIPLWPVTQFFVDWSYRDIYKYIDLGHLKEEYDYWTSNSCLNPLPVHRINSNPVYTEVADWLDYCRNATYVSIDIETIRPPKSRVATIGAEFISGHMYTIALAPRSNESLSFQLWNWNPQQRRTLWTKLNDVLKNIPNIGQNYFQFDTHYQEAYGLEPNLALTHDTRIRHQLLWPELSHSLQFQTKQYTRIPFYKDEGKQWNPKYLKQLLNYNALDTIATYQIFEAQEVEFDERSHLR